MKLGYSYFDDGNVKKIDDLAHNSITLDMSSGGYDRLDRLIRADGPWGTLSYSYDAAGNRLSRGLNGSATTYGYFPGLNRLQSVSDAPGATFTYSTAGELQADGNASYSYTPTGMLERAELNGQAITYRYDGDDLRALKASGEVARHYYIHGPAGQLLAEFTDTGAELQWQLDYIYAGSRLLAAVRPSGSGTLIVGKSGAGTGTVTSTPAGIICGPTCSATMPTGTLVTLTATADPGWVFAGWTGDAECGDGVVTLTQATTCTATFIAAMPETCAATTAVVVAQPPTPLDAMWQGTGVTVTAGQLVRIRVEGTQTWTKGGQAWTAAGNAADPTGPANAPLPGGPRMALVGRFGVTGTPFLVGSEAQALADAAGELVLAPNDEWYFVWGNAGSLTASICTGGTACTVEATATVPPTGTAGTPVAFAVTATCAWCGVTAPSYSWTFGDGSALSPVPNPSHIYATAGTYTWTVTVQAGSGTTSQTGTITVQGTSGCTPTGSVVVAQPPTSLVQMWQSTGVTATAGQTVTVQVPGAQTWVNAGHAWTADGDGTDLTGPNNSPLPGAPRMALIGRIGTDGAPFLVGSAAQVTAAATGPVYLAPNDDWYLLWDNAGSLTVSTCAESPVCTVTATATVPTSATAGAPVALTATGTPSGCGAGAPTYTWDFGDGSAASTTASPTHVYVTAGMYGWAVTVQAGSAMAVRTGTITVSAAPGCTPTAAAVAAQTPASLAAMWQGTGVTVAAGQLVTISVAAGQTWTKGGQAWTAAGNAADPTSAGNSPMPGAPRMALIGRIGTTGASFLVGTSTQFTAAASGELFLAPNDEWYLVWGNAGSLTVAICVGGVGGAGAPVAEAPDGRAIPEGRIGALAPGLTTDGRGVFTEYRVGGDAGGPEKRAAAGGCGRHRAGDAARRGGRARRPAPGCERGRLPDAGGRRRRDRHAARDPRRGDLPGTQPAADGRKGAVKR